MKVYAVTPSRLSRRGFLALVAGTAAVVNHATTARSAEAPAGLNVLFVMTDEQHWRSLSCAGNPYIATPNMDRLAREGVRFTHATCVTPYCSPSRASLITGVYPHRHRILQNVTPNRNDQPPLAPTAFANTECILHAGGYATAHRGKWHLGDTGDFPCYESWAYASRHPRDYKDMLDRELPAARFAGNRDPGQYLARPVEKTDAIRNGWQAFQEIPHNGVAYIATIGRTVIPPHLLPETQITNSALEWIEAHAADRFMMTVSWSPPHDLWVTPDPYYGMVDRNAIRPHGSTDMPAWDRKAMSKRLGDIMGPDGVREYEAIYHGMVKYIDDQLGRLLSKLDELGLAEKTLVIFTSDHGDMVGAHGVIGKSINSIYDDLLRIPLLVRLPGRIPAGTVVDRFVSQIDVMPTILDYLGRTAPAGIHGASLRPLIEGKDVAWRDYAFCQRADRVRMLRTDRWKYTLGPKPPICSLYDMRNDPHEDNNLADDPAHADTLRKMHARLLDVMRADGDPLAKTFPDAPPLKGR